MEAEPNDFLIGVKIAYLYISNALLTLYVTNAVMERLILILDGGKGKGQGQREVRRLDFDHIFLKDMLKCREKNCLEYKILSFIYLQQIPPGPGL
jgi:hypothetical protein